MRVGILGSGLMGAKLGTIFARAGHEVVFSYARNKEKLEKLARETQGKARAGTPQEAAQEANRTPLPPLRRGVSPSCDGEKSCYGTSALRSSGWLDPTNSSPMAKRPWAKASQ